MWDAARNLGKKIRQRRWPSSIDSAQQKLRRAFDPNFYRFLNPGLYGLTDSALLDHFLRQGWKEGRDPNAEFSTRAYMQMNPDVRERQYNPLLHFLRHGETENRMVRLSSWGASISDPVADTYSIEDLDAIMPHFNARFYRDTNPELARLSDRALAAHFIVIGWQEGRNPREDFSVGDYLQQNRDISDAGINPFLHYVLFGMKEGRKTQGDAVVPLAAKNADAAAVAKYFDPAYYRQMNDDVTGSDSDLLDHYMSQGWKEGRDPSTDFSTQFYLEEYPDIDAAGINPLLHYALFGRVEGRRARGGEPSRLALSPEADLVPEHLSPVMHQPRPDRPATTPVQINPAAMTLHWVVPDFARGGGGHMTIFRMVRFLELFGHRCKIWIETPTIHDDADEAYQTIVKYFQCVGADVDFVENGFFEATGDVAIATAWSTAYLVNAAPHFGAKCYFVQDHEPQFFPTGTESLLAQHSYAFDMGCICASPWLQQIMSERYGRWARHFHLACDQDTYHILAPDAHRARFAKTRKGPFKIAVYARDHSPRRCVPLALMALQTLAQSRSDFEVHFFGQDHLPFSATNFTAFNHGVLDATDLAKLYNDCDAGLCFSATNYSLVPQEMMACGLPLLELDNDSTRAIFPADAVTMAGPAPQDIADALARMMDDTDLRSDQSKAALDWVHGFSWESAARNVEQAIIDFVATRPGLSAPAVVPDRETVMDVVIPTFNGLGELEPVIEAVRAQRGQGALQIHCIDSSSTDGTTEWLRQQPDIALTVIAQKDFQHGRTRNQAAAEGKAPLIGFLTQDALPATPFWARDIRRMMDHYPQAAGLFGRHLPYPHHPEFVRHEIERHFANMLKHPLALSKDTDPDLWAAGDPGWRQVLHFYSDNNSAMRRSVWNDIPYPELDYGEDQVWARDIIEAGYTKLYAPTAAVFHSHDYTPDETYARSKTESAFFFKHFGYRLGDGSPAQIGKQIKREQQRIQRWALRRTVAPDEMEKLLGNAEAKFRGWHDGLAEAQGKSPAVWS